MIDLSTSAGPPARAVDAARGLSWWSEAWALFIRNAGMWIVLGLILIVIFAVLGIIPILGSLAASLVAPVLGGGWLLAARKVEGGGTLEVGDLFEGFKDKLTPLLILGALMLAATFIIGAVVGALGFGAALGMMAEGSGHSAGMFAAMGAGMLAVLVALVLGAVVAMAIWFAPGLVVFEGMAPFEALKSSVAASLKNAVPFLIYGIIALVAMFVASIPFGLGWIVLAPLFMLTGYVSYKDVFGA